MSETRMLKIAQAHERISERRWRWSVWLEADATVLDQVQNVTYRLHSSFASPIRNVTDRASAFRLDSEGWGEFVIRATVEFKDGSHDAISHRLLLGTSETKGVGRPRVFVSHGFADSEFVADLTSLLRRENVDARGFYDLQRGASIVESIQGTLQRVDAVVGVLSPAVSPNVIYELGYAMGAGRPVVLIGNREQAPFDFVRSRGLIAPRDVGKAGAAVLQILQNAGESDG